MSYDWGGSVTFAAEMDGPVDVREFHAALMLVAPRACVCAGRGSKGEPYQLAVGFDAQYHDGIVSVFSGYTIPFEIVFDGRPNDGHTSVISAKLKHFKNVPTESF